MMFRFLGLVSLLWVCAALTIGCSSTDTQTVGDEDILSEIQEVQGQNSVTEGEVIEDFGAEEDFADDFGSDEVFAEEGAPAEENLDDAFAEEDSSLEDAMAFDEPLDEPAQDPFAPAAEQPMSPPTGSRVEVSAIDYTDNSQGGSIRIRTSAPANYTTRYNPETNQYVIEIQNASLRDSLRRPFIMKEFETNFGTINSYQEPGSSVARIVVQMKAGSEPVSQAEGNEIVILPAAKVGTVAAAEPAAPVVTPVKKGDEWKESYNVEEAEKAEGALRASSLDEFMSGNMKFYGRPISIQVSGAPIQDVINFIADESGVNMVLGDDVTGNVTLKLRQVPWDQALVIILRSKGLGYVRQGNILRITQLSTLQNEAASAKAMVDAQTSLTPVRVKVIPISYANPAELSGQVTNFLTPQRGRVVADERTSSLIVTDTAEVLTRIERLVKELDLPPTQVMIEGKIVEATENFSRTLGVNWGFTGANVQLSETGGFQGSPINLQATYNASGISGAVTDSLNSSLQLSVGTIDFFGNLTASLGLAQSDSIAKVISSPRVVTMNRSPATISQSGEVISVTTTRDEAGNTFSSPVRNEVALSLAVTPQITSEGSVILDVDVQRQFAGAIAEETTNSRPVNTRSARTKVLVPNGQTAVIGGIYQNDETNTERGVPVLKDIPVLGWLFKGKTMDRNKNELLIFLTPRILNPQEQAVSEQ